jgi:methionyl-tRNA formyltransferase
VRLLFAGTPETALPSLDALLGSERHEVVGVLTRPDAPAGRNRTLVRSPVARRADEAGIPVHTPRRPNEDGFVDVLEGLRLDCAPVVAYGALLPSRVLAVPRVGWVNLHLSLLPAWRGAAPVQRAILAGDDITGASTFLIDEGLDTGPLFGVTTEPIRPDDTAGSLLGRLAHSGAELLLATLDGIEAGTVQPVPQSTEGVSMAAKLTVQDARIDFSVPAAAIDRRVRACTPTPGAWCTFRSARLKLGPVGLTDERLKPGEIAAGRDAVLVGTATTAVRLGSVQAPGKRPTPAADWARGARIASGERLG